MTRKSGAGRRRAAASSNRIDSAPRLTRSSACRRYCQQCGSSRPNDPDCRRLSAQVGSYIRRGLLKVSKCTWEAQKDYDATYETARAQLEAAGYACLTQKLYVEYRAVQGATIQFERQARILVIGGGCACSE